MGSSTTTAGDRRGKRSRGKTCLRENFVPELPCNRRDKWHWPFWSGPNPLDEPPHDRVRRSGEQLAKSSALASKPVCDQTLISFSANQFMNPTPQSPLA